MDYRPMKIFYTDINEMQTVELPSFSFELLNKTIKKKYQNISDLNDHSFSILFENFRIKSQEDFDEALAKAHVQSKYHFDVVVSMIKEESCSHTIKTDDLPRSYGDRVSMSSEDDNDSFEIVAVHFNDVHCSLCNVEIFDIRYHCLNCENDFILCEACEAHSYKSHPIAHVFAKVRHPEAYNSLTSFRRICSLYPQSQELNLKCEINSAVVPEDNISVKKTFVDASNESSQFTNILEHGCHAERTHEQANIAIQTDFRHSCSVTHNVTQTTIEEQYSDEQSNSSPPFSDEFLQNQLEVVSFDWTLVSPRQGSFSTKEVLRQSWLLQCQGPIVWPKKCLRVIPIKQNAIETFNDKTSELLFDAVHCLAKLRLCRSTGQLVCKTLVSLNVTPEFLTHIDTITDQRVVINWHVCTDSFPPRPLAPRMSTMICLHQRTYQEKLTKITDGLEVDFYSEKLSSKIDQGDHEVNNDSSNVLTCLTTSTMSGSALDNSFQGSLTSSDRMEQMTRTNSQNSLVNPPDEFSFLPSSTDEVLPIYIKRKEVRGSEDPKSVQWVFVWSKDHPTSPLSPNEHSSLSSVVEDSCIPSATSPPNCADSNDQFTPAEIIREPTSSSPLISLDDHDLNNTNPSTSVVPNRIEHSCEEPKVNKEEDVSLFRLIETQSEAWIPATSYHGPSTEDDSSSANVEISSSESYHSNSTQRLWMPESNSTHVYQYESLAPMNKLISMGFYDRSLNQRLLNEFNDNLELVVNALLNM